MGYIKHFIIIIIIIIMTYTYGICLGFCCSL